MLTELKCGKTHVQFINSDAPPDQNCEGTVRVRFAAVCKAAIEKQIAEEAAGLHPIANGTEEK